MTLAFVILIGILIFLGLKFPAFGKFVLIGGGIIVLLIVIFFWWTISDSNDKQKVAQSLIQPNQIEATNLTMKKGFSLYQLSGEIKNNSSYELTDLTFAIKAYDCPSDTITNDCTIIGQDDDVSTYIDVPPNQVRAINDATYVNLDNMPAVRGNFLWSYSIVKTIAKNP